MKINEKNQIIDYWRVSKSRKNNAFIPLYQQPQMPQ